MPTYDYQCDDCGHAFEKFQSITARPLRKCPTCGKFVGGNVKFCIYCGEKLNGATVDHGSDNDTVEVVEE